MTYNPNQKVVVTSNLVKAGDQLLLDYYLIQVEGYGPGVYPVSAILPGCTDLSSLKTPAGNLPEGVVVQMVGTMVVVFIEKPVTLAYFPEFNWLKAVDVVQDTLREQPRRSIEIPNDRFELNLTSTPDLGLDGVNWQPINGG